MTLPYRGCRMKSSLATHRLIRETAKEFAGAFYDGAAHDNTFYKMYCSERKFVAKEWGRFVPHARSIMAQMLARNDVSEHEKEEIEEALQFDRSLPQSQQHGLEELLLH